MRRHSLLSKFLLLSIFLGQAVVSVAQTGVAINGSGAAPNANAILDVTSTTKGALLPRMTTGQRTAFVPTGVSGMTVYDTTTETYWYWNGTVNAWREIPNTTAIVHNTLDGAYDQGGAGAGRTITADAGAVNVAGAGGLTVNGNVGIGNTSPGYKLDVTGDTRTSGDFFGNIHVDDTRFVDDAPTAFDNEVAFDFKERATVGVPGSGTYSGMMTIAPWQDNSGDASHQINFNEGGLYWRQGQPAAATWGTWYKILTTADGLLTGSGTLNYLARWTPDGATLGIGTTYDNGTNVGLGTTSPGQKLEVNGNIALPSASGNKSIYTWDAADANWRIGMSATPGFTRGLATSHVQYLTFASGAGQGFAVGDNVTGLSAFEVASSGSGYNAYFRGNVGIGTASPDARLNVGDANGATIYLTREDNTTATNDVLGSLLFDSTDDTSPSTTDASAGIRAFAAENHGNSNKGGYLTFFTKPAGTTLGNPATERLRIAANGYIGVANSSPIGPLSVGNSSVSGSDGFLVIGKNDGGGGTRQMRLGFDASFNFVIGDYGNNNTAGTWTSPFKVNYAAPNNSLSIASTGVVTMSSLGSGLVKATSGVLSIASGTDLPSGSNNYIQNQNASDQTANFRVSGSGSASIYYVNHGSGNVLEVGDDAWIGDVNAANTVGITGQQAGSNGGLRLGTNTAAYLYSDGTANIGVGTSSPVFKLHVNGDFHPDGKIVVQNGVNGGASRGIWMWTAGDANWGIYMGQSGAGLALDGGSAVAGGGFTSHAIRFRTYNNASNGFIFENSSNVNLLSIRSDNGRATFRGGVLFDCPSCGSTSTVDGSSDWGDLTIQGRVLSTNSNLHLSPPGGSKVIINSTYRAAGGGTGTTGLDIEDGGIRMRKSYYYFQRYCYCGCYGCGSGSYDLGTWDFCAVAQVGFKNNQSTTDEDDDVQCAVYPNGYGYGEQTNYTATYTEAYNTRRRWYMYLEAYEDTNGVTCAANCMNFE